MQMVELEAVEAGANGRGAEISGPLMADPLAHDAWRLRRLIERHMHYTNSARAKHILANWSELLPKFVKIVPTDYRRALTEHQIEPEVAQAPARAKLAGAARG
jgi:glutamate synthase (NADPH/NADH) large chain